MEEHVLLEVAADDEAVALVAIEELDLAVVELDRIITSDGEDFNNRETLVFGAVRNSQRDARLELLSETQGDTAADVEVANRAFREPVSILDVVELQRGSRLP